MQDFELYGSRLNRHNQRSGNERSPEATTPPIVSRSSSMRRHGDDQVSHSEFSPGLLDLHSFDTELLPEVWIFFMFDNLIGNEISVIACF